MLPSHVSGSIRQGGLQVFLFRRKKSTLDPLQLHFILYFFFFLRSASHLCFSNGTAGIA